MVRTNGRLDWLVGLARRASIGPRHYERPVIVGRALVSGGCFTLTHNLLERLQERHQQEEARAGARHPTGT